MSKDRPPASADLPRESGYRGRWIARLRGRIVAQGGTPDQALQAALSLRHKEKPAVSFMPIALPFPSLLADVERALPEDQEIFLVGGAVRDLLMDRQAPDLDFAVPRGGIALARRVANALRSDFMILDEERDTARAIVTADDGTRTRLDFASYRGGGSLEADLRARDFTINALAFDLRNQTVLDPLGGAADLRAKRIRECSTHSFSDDPVRLLRAVRLAATLGFQIEADTRQHMKESAAGIALVSPERQRDEFFRILAGPKPDAALRALESLGVLEHLLPELVPTRGVEQPSPHVHDVWQHTLAAVQALESILTALGVAFDAAGKGDLFTGLLTSRLGRYREHLARHFAASLNPDRPARALLVFAALYHDVGKPARRAPDESGRIRFFGHDELGATMAVERAVAFRLSNDEIARIRTVISNHMRFHFHTSRVEGEAKAPSRRAIYRFFRDSGEAGVDLVLLGLADLRGTRGHTLKQETWTAGLDVARVFLENYWERPNEIVSPPRLLDGRELMTELNLEAGPDVGRLLAEIRERQATGEIGDRPEAIAFARTWLAQNGEAQRSPTRATLDDASDDGEGTAV